MRIVELQLPERLVRDLERSTAGAGRSLASEIESALREHLLRAGAGTTVRVELPVDGEGGLQPGTSLDDGRVLREVLDRGCSIEGLR